MLKLEHISYIVKDGDKEKVILKDISLEIGNNETIVVTGHNGSGKSTLMKIIMGIIAPTSGRIIFDDTDITDYTITDRARLGMAYAFQTPIRFKGLKVSDMLDTAQKTNSKISEVCNYLSKVGLCAREYIDRDLDDSLSGGELKRIEIATTLARGAKLNIFDEPEAGIDLWSFDGLISAFKENQNIYHTTNIIISHQEKILNIADKIIVLKNGHLKNYDSKDVVLPTLTDTKAIVCEKITQGVNGNE